MPRIRDAFLDCVIYLYASEQDAEEGARSGGSGFLVGLPAEEAGIWFTYVVTNRHVIEDGSCVVRMRTEVGTNEIMPTDERAWYFHPEGDDLAVMLLRFDWRKTKFSIVPVASFLTKEIVSEYDIGPGDEAFLVGRFINHEGKQKNLPTVRFGCIAQMPFEPVRQSSGFGQESFLVEARSIGGYSGSPVFAFIPSLSERENAKDWNIDLKTWDPSTGFAFMRSHGPWLLGVDWGHINDWQPVRDRAGEPVNRTDPHASQVRVNTGMAAVVPAWKLTELLYSDDLVNQRNTHLAQLQRERERNLPPATSD